MHWKLRPPERQRQRQEGRYARLPGRERRDAKGAKGGRYEGKGKGTAPLRARWMARSRQACLPGIRRRGYRASTTATTKAPIGRLAAQGDARSTPGQARSADGGSKLPHST
jgi:hypothetical protein